MGNSFGDPIWYESVIAESRYEDGRVQKSNFIQSNSDMNFLAPVEEYRGLHDQMSDRRFWKHSKDYPNLTEPRS
ncbi:MAG: hypothetical protein CM1200mP14_24110 [Gammaproteobacteria bacterium]|nr:MAG: hypothetical protein CM1200mP14_24110 [Gammaproteobacteria bacterium]